MTAQTDALQILAQRGFLAQVSDEDGLRRQMEQGPITAYVGFDPTAPSLHVGHLVQVMALAHLQRAGHRPIAVVGGGTGMVGDPTDRATERPLLSVDEIDRNAQELRQQLGRYLDFGPGRAMLVNNADWLRRIGYMQFLREVGRHFTLNQLMQHETYRKRYEASSLSVLELNYAMIQAYDFLHLYREEGCVLQVGGNDQWFNILAGVELVRRAAGGRVFALTTPLITTSSGTKMSKSAGNAPWLSPRLESAYDFYQYWRNTEDPDVGRFLRLFTFVPLETIAELEGLRGAEINRAKEVLAFEATALTHGVEQARAAQETARARFQGEGEDQGPAIQLVQPARLAELLVQHGLATSRREAKQLIQGGGVRLDGVPQPTDRELRLEELPHLLTVGKRRIRIERTA